MWLSSWLLALTLSCGCLAQTLIQPQASITKSAGRTGRIRCQVEGATVDNDYPIHWYQQKPGQPPTRILYYGGSVTRDPGFGSTFNAGTISNSEFYLVIEKLTAEQSATYYCAYWVTGAWKKIFGSGTRLIVTGTEVKAPTLRLFPPQIVDAEGFLVCLVTGFFPEVIKVQWKIAGDEKADTSTNTFTDSVKEMHGKTYSLISRFKISKLDWEAKTFTCHVQHEGGSREASISRQSRLAASKTDVVTGPPCPPSVQESLEITDEGTSSSSLKVATLTYTLLLMKSVLYCGIISFILYKVEYRGTQKPL